ncbi:hypothetical protein [Nitrincola iocasae]|jgi:hypothetical protein|uniref:Uncharacterized protein n=1 Tax=Nitrincola iocasae TaxID=2614693 RepID=A0A5J6LCA7_9GAMM|nr:hypothetical protein [Nitrincola iocasae]QEW06046.1 hypothetical protein F5I99_05795 [Nitrincola iocasae]
MTRRTFFSLLRTLLLTLLVMVLLLNVWFSQTRQENWQTPASVWIYPINADGATTTQAWIDTLSDASFDDMEAFFQRESRRYRLGLEQPIQVNLATQLDALPPDIPQDPSIVDAVIWALKMRFWVWRHDDSVREPHAIRIFIRFYAQDNPGPMQHSLGLQKGLIGLVNGYAGAAHAGRNNLVAAHELLHTLGATDKYDMDTLEPLWPDGYADPTQYPLYPQTRAEIMSGRLQVSPGWLMLPPSLDHAVIGPATAIEINWLAVHDE